MEKLTFNKFNSLRKEFLENNSDKDHIILKGSNNILISAPHGVSQVRLGKCKAQEIGSLSMALCLQHQTNCFLIAKTQCNNDDANFDDESTYKDSIIGLIKKYNIKYILDLHGLASYRDCDINLGIHIGDNIRNNIELFNKLNESLSNNCFKVSIDQPFMASSKTICSSMVKQFNDIWAIQIEINCGITNKKENFTLNYKLIEILRNWINSI
ncbi:MAG: hypothetical protein IKC49_01335 [Clostridia bacterium]|nr:hypothetical protein [Clostridia bacterium]